MAYSSRADVRPQKGRQSQLFKMIKDGVADFYLVGGSRFGGKSELLSMIDLLFAHDKLYRSIKFRREYSELMGANSLWEKAENQYPWFNAIPNISNKFWKWPSGAKSLYSHMFREGDEESHRGKGYSAVFFDEINQFTWNQVRMLMTCLRSEADMNSFMVGTLNPDPDSWCMKFIEYYLDPDTGFPDQSKCGEVRYYIIHEGEPVFSKDEEFFKEHYPDAVYPTLPDGTKMYIKPKRFTFFFFNIFDNEIGMRSNPQYLSELNSLPEHEKQTQLFGNWFAREKSENLFDRNWLKKVDYVPQGSVCVRAWDKAYSDQTNKGSDYTASIKMWKTPDKRYVITGDFDPAIHDSFKQGQEPIYGRFKRLSGERNLLMIQQAHYDGDECTIVHPEESGAGKGECEELKKLFTENGFRSKTVKTGTAPQAKRQKFVNFTSAAENGLVDIVESSFGNQATLNAYYKELENFDGISRSTRTMKDDWVDATSDCFLTLCKEKVYKAYALPDCTSPTKYTSYKRVVA